MIELIERLRYISGIEIDEERIAGMNSDETGQGGRDPAGKSHDGTRHALIEAGLQLFGEYGYEATSTRMLAKASGANVSAIPYYFGGKEGLYLAVVEHIAQRSGSYIGSAYTQIVEAREKSDLSKVQAKKALKKLIEAMCDMFVDSDEPKSWALIIMREQVRPTSAFNTFYKSMMKNAHEMISTLIAQCVGLEPDSDEAKIRAHTLIGQVLAFVSSREVVLRRLGVSSLSEHHLGLIRKVAWAQVEASLKIPRLDEGENS